MKFGKVVQPMGTPHLFILGTLQPRHRRRRHFAVIHRCGTYDFRLLTKVLIPYRILCFCCCFDLYSQRYYIVTISLLTVVTRNIPSSSAARLVQYLPPGFVSADILAAHCPPERTYWPLRSAGNIVNYISRVCTQRKGYVL